MTDTASGLRGPGTEATAAFGQLLPELVNQVVEKFRTDERYECGPFPCELHEMVADLQERFGRALVGIYDLGLAAQLRPEFHALVLPLLYRGAEPSFSAAMLDAWLVALRTTMERRWQAELAEPLARLRHDITGERWTPLPEAAAPAPVAELVGLLVARRRRAAAERALDHLRPAGAPEKTFEELVGPALGRIGELWVRNRLSVADEHAASDICRYIVLRLLDEARPAPPSGRRALVTCAPGEEHEIGAEMLAGCLELRGWEVFSAGRNAPSVDVVRSAVNWRPQAVLLSATMVASLPGLRGLATELRRALPGVRVVAGGRAALLARASLAGAVDALAEDIAAGCRQAEPGGR